MKSTIAPPIPAADQITNPPINALTIANTPNAPLAAVSATTPEYELFAFMIITSPENLSLYHCVQDQCQFHIPPLRENIFVKLATYNYGTREVHFTSHRSRPCNPQQILATKGTPPLLRHQGCCR